MSPMSNVYKPSLLNTINDRYQEFEKKTKSRMILSKQDNTIYTSSNYKQT